MNNRSLISITDFTSDQEFKLLINFVTYFNVKVEKYYSTNTYFYIEFNTQENFGQIRIGDYELILEHNVFEDFVIMRNYLKEQINQLSPEGE